MAANIISLTNIRKVFRTKAALAGVDLQVNRGEMTALIGPSGSGKSTLLRCIAGLERADGGQVAVAAPRQSVAFIFQQFNLVGRLSLYTNAVLGALGRLPFWRGVLGAWPQEARTLAMASLDRMGLADHAGQRANTLSGGQQQRGAIARALTQRAEIILADEPVASLDPVTARRVMESLRGLNREDGITVVVTLHQLDHVRAFCDRAVALKDGLIVYDGPVTELSHSRLIDIYGPEFEDTLGAAA